MIDHLIFGYGSLLWRPGFAFDFVSRAEVRGWSRRLVQASPDHRGTEQSPGRVPSLVKDDDGLVVGRVFRPRWPKVMMPKLDHRERGGYDRLDLKVQLPSGEEASAVTYAGQPGNRWWLGPAAPEVIAKQVKDSRGESGFNRDYLVLLQRSLLRLDVVDEELELVLAALRRL